MNTIIWGPSAWKLFHLSGLAFDIYYNNKEVKDCKFKKCKKMDDKEDNIKIIEKFYLSLTRLLPCKWCREHYQILIKKCPIDFNDLFNWTYKIHDIVNTRLAKQNKMEKCHISSENCIIFYKKLLSTYQKNNTFVGFDFINSVLFDYPDLYDIYYYDFINGIILFSNLLNIPIMIKYSLKINKIMDKYNKGKRTSLPRNEIILNYFNYLVNLGKYLKTTERFYPLNIDKLYEFYNKQTVDCKEVKSCKKIFI